MEAEIGQVVQAIVVASDPSQASLHQQALAYLQTIQENAQNTWQLALAMFVDAAADGTRKYPPQARFFALRVLDDFLDNRFEPLDDDSFRVLQQSLIGYIQSEYVYGSAESNASFLRNKFSHTLTLFFLCTYIDQWPTFFQDIFSLIRPSEASSSATFNPHVSLLLFHLVLEISGEVADQLIKSARAFDEARHRRDGLVRDAVRERDAPGINEAVVTIVASCEDRLRVLRAGGTQNAKEIATTEEMVDWGIRTFGSYVGWIDISLTVTPNTIQLLFALLADPALSIRLATSLALLRITAKGLKEPNDKLQLLKVLSLGEVIDALEKSTREEHTARGKDTDEGEESFREALGRLLNQLGVELMKLVEEAPDEVVRTEAMRMVNQVLPVMLRIIGDDYDDTSSTVFPFLLAVLAHYKRIRKSTSDPLDGEKRGFLTSLMEVILQKSRWDEDDDDPDDLDEDERAAFEGLRKDLRSFMEAVLTLDADLVTNGIKTLVMTTLSTYQNGGSLSWQDAELAIYLVFILGDINKTSIKGRAAFVQAPTVPREQRKDVDYSVFPLTAHGEMLMALYQSRISAYPHKAVVMQFFETVARYGDFFKVRKECIIPTLEAMVDNRGLHHSDSAVQSRVFYLFQRFIRESKSEVPTPLALTLLQGVQDLLVPKIDLPELDNPEEQDLMTEAIANQGFFDAQLYLFETVGLLVSLFSKERDQQAALLHSVLDPLLGQLRGALAAPAKNAQDVLPILTIHHVMMALGNIAKGFPEYPTPPPEGYVLPPAEFQEVANAILLSLEAMNTFKPVRDAARFAFARILATTGPTTAHLIPRLMANLLAHFEPSELADFMNFIALLIHKLQQDFAEVLDQLIGPLNAHISAVLSQPVTGTDDQLTHVDTKKAYLTLLNGIMSAKLHGVFLSERNKDAFEALLTSMEQVAEDISDPASQKAAFTFLGRCISIWGSPTDGLPGFERFIFERLIPSAFKVPASPQFNVKDGQMLVVLHEIANFLQITLKTRGQDAYDFLLNVFLPSQGWPADAANDFCTKLKDLDLKSFRKYFADMVRASRS